MQVGTLSFSHPSFGVCVVFIFLLGHDFSCRCGPCPPPPSLVWIVCFLSFFFGTISKKNLTIYHGAHNTGPCPPPLSLVWVVCFRSLSFLAPGPGCAVDDCTPSAPSAPKRGIGEEDRVHTCTSRILEGRSGAQVGLSLTLILVVILLLTSTRGRGGARSNVQNSLPRRSRLGGSRGVPVPVSPCLLVCASPHVPGSEQCCRRGRYRHASQCLRGIGMVEFELKDSP